MNNVKLLDSKIEERNFGSSFDALLNGVAQGLARMFPPVEDTVLDGDSESISDGDSGDGELSQV